MEPNSSSPDLSLQLVPLETHSPKLAGASPFRRVVDPELRESLHHALIRLVEDHQHQISYMVESGQLEVGSYKEYIELLSKFLRETLGSRVGVKYLLDSCGLEGAHEDEINLDPALRWRSY